MKKIFYLLLLMLLPMAAGAEPVEIDGIWYNLVTKANIAEVTNCLGGNTQGGETYSGSVSIPSAVNYNGTEYSVTSIGDNAFFSCHNLTAVTIPNSVTSLGTGAFQLCDRMSSVTIPNSVHTIKDFAFDSCKSLTSVTIPNSVTSIGLFSFANCIGLASFTIPNNLLYIEQRTFSGCIGLTSVSIPNSVKAIGVSAFHSCTNLTSVFIGSGVSSINRHAFASCSNIADVYCYGETVPTTISDAFQDSYIEYATLHVPIASIDAYKAKLPWSSFKTIVGIDGTQSDNPTPKQCAVPTISYVKGRLVFECETEEVEFVSEIKNCDVKQHYDAEVSLMPVYEITVRATKSGLDDSATAKASIRWRNGRPVFVGFSRVMLEEDESRGDINADGSVGIGDIVTITNIMAGLED